MHGFSRCRYERASRGLKLGRSEETKGFVVYLLDTKKVVITQHVQSIQTLSQAQNEALLSQAGVRSDLPGARSDLPGARSDLPGGRSDSATAPVQRSDPVSGGSPPVLTAEVSRLVQPAEMPSRVQTRPAAKRKPSQRVRDAHAAGYVEADISSDEDYGIHNVDITDPKTFAAAMKTPEAEKWQEAINEELKTLRADKTWVAVPKPANVRALHSKWVFKTKTDAQGKVERYKARLVACGNEQEEGVNYAQTFAPVLDMATARFILALGVIWGVPPRHGDIPSAYTKAKFTEEYEVHLQVPKGVQLTEEERISGGSHAVFK